jgi:hypothetical protein
MQLESSKNISRAATVYIETRITNIVEAISEGGDIKDIACDLDDILTFVNSNATTDAIFSNLYRADVDLDPSPCGNTIDVELSDSGC